MPEPEPEMGNEPTSSMDWSSKEPPWDVHVDVYLEPEGSEPPFYLRSCLPQNSDGDLVFRNCGRHGFFVNFHLQDPHGTRYLFPRSAQLKDALWSREGPGCPPENYGKQWREFKAARVSPDGKTLTVRNRNETETKFGYTLRVTKDGGESYLDLDPGGDNQNGDWEPL